MSDVSIFPTRPCAAPTREQLLARRWLRPPLTALVQAYAENMIKVLQSGTPSPDPVMRKVAADYQDQHRQAVQRMVALRLAALAQVAVDAYNGPPAHYTPVVAVLARLVDDALPAAMAHQPLPWQRRRRGTALRLVGGSERQPV